MGVGVCVCVGGRVTSLCLLNKQYTGIAGSCYGGGPFMWEEHVVMVM